MATHVSFDLPGGGSNGGVDERQRPSAASKQSYGAKQSENSGATGRQSGASKESKVSRGTVWDRLSVLNIATRERLLANTQGVANVLREVSISHHKLEQLSLLQRLTRSTPFGLLISLVIFMNAVTIGIEGSSAREESKEVLLLMETIFLYIYCAEILLRIIADGRQNLTDSWFIFDFIIVIIGILDNLLSDVVSINGGAITVLRVARIAKVVRVFRLFRFFRELSLIVSSMAAAVRIVAWMWVLLGIIIFVFSVLFTNLLGREYEDDAQMQMLFGDVVKSSFTLFTIMTLEGWADICRDVASVSPAMAAVIIFFITITSYAIMNVVVAVLVQYVIEKAMDNQDFLYERMETQLREVTTGLWHLFKEADEDCDGNLTREEFIRALEHDKLRHAVQSMDLDVGDPGHLFDAVDVLKEGSLSLESFIQGTMQLRGNARARRLFELHCDTVNHVKSMDTKVEQNHESLKEQVAQLQQVQNEVRKVAKDISELKQAITQSHFLPPNGPAHCGSIQIEKVDSELGDLKLQSISEKCDEIAQESESRSQSPNPLKLHNVNVATQVSTDRVNFNVAQKKKHVPTLNCEEIPDIQFPELTFSSNSEIAGSNATNVALTSILHRFQAEAEALREECHSMIDKQAGISTKANRLSVLIMEALEEQTRCEGAEASAEHFPKPIPSRIPSSMDSQLPHRRFLQCCSKPSTSSTPL